MEDINKNVQPVGYDPDEDDQELQNMKDLPNKEDDQHPPEEDDDDAYSDDETKKKINTATTAISSGKSSEEALKSSLPKKVITPIKCSDETQSEDEEEYENSPSLEEEKCKLFKGVVPKDIEQKKEMMSFIAYP